MPHTAVNKLSSAQEQRTELLLRKAQHASVRRASQLRHEVVLCHRGLATSIAHRYDHRGLDREDLEQVALLGLVQAVRRYKPGYGSGFFAFAVPTIAGELKRHFRDHGWAVRPPRHLQEQSLEVRACADRLTQELGREPSSREVAQTLGIDDGDVGLAQAVDSQYVARSMDAPVEHAGGMVLADTLGAVSTDLARVEVFQVLRPALCALKARDRLIIRLRFVDNLTQRQIGQRIGVSQMQVSRLLAEILHRLRMSISGEYQHFSAAS